MLPWRRPRSIVLYLESLPWSIRPGVDWVVVEANVFDKFEPYFTDEEIASARKWDEEHNINQ